MNENDAKPVPAGTWTVVPSRDDLRALDNLRDQFAMAALTGMLANPNVSGTPTNFAVSAYDFADFMMSERTHDRP